MYHYTYGHPVIPTPFGQKYLINADTTASGYPHRQIEDIINQQILPYYNNTHSNSYSGRLMAHYVEQSRTIIRKCVNANSNDKVIFTGNGCSGAITHLIHCLDLKNSNPDELVVIVSKAEHHSNHLPWTHLPVTLIYVPLDENGLIDRRILEKNLAKYQHKKIIVSFIATSNVTGVHQPTSQISKLVHQYGGLIFWDFAASAPYIPINLHTSDLNGDYYDAVFISTHKFFGGPGTPGILIANQKLFKNTVPFCPAGGTVRFVCSAFQKYSNNVETKETGGTPNILGSIKAGLVFDFKCKNQKYIIQRDQQVLEYVQSRLSKIREIHLLTPTGNLNRLPIFPFIVPGLHYNLVVVLLNDLFGIQSRGGVSCCSMLAQELLHIDSAKQRQIYQSIITDHGVPSDYGWCRVSFNYIMTDAIIDYIINSIEYIAKNGHKYVKYYRYIPEKNNWIFKGWKDLDKLRLSVGAKPKKYVPNYLN